MTDHLEEVEKLINHLREVISDLVETHDPDIDNVAYTISHARKYLQKAKRELKELEAKKNE